MSVSKTTGARNLDAIAKATAALSVGAASLAVSALTAIPDLLGNASLAKIYAQVVQNGAFGAVGAGVFAAIIWGWRERQAASSPLEIG